MTVRSAAETPVHHARSPLATIEERVREAARRLDLDVSRDDGHERLQELIDAEISRWDEAHRRGTTPVAIADPQALAVRALRNLAGYGPLQGLLDDDDVWEIMVNAPDAIFVKRHRGADGYHDEVFHDDDHVTRTLTKILDDASGAHRKLDPTAGLQDAQLDGGARLHIVHRDLSRGGHLIVNIRKFTGVAFRSLDELVDRDMLGADVAAFLAACVRSRGSVVFSGAPGSGKTTLLSCAAAELDPALRVVIAEEVFEADVPLANVAAMQTRSARPERPAIDLRRLVAGFLRMAPDVAVVGEVRDREALPLLLTLSSGVTGYTTIHAGSARQALSRLRFVCQLAETSSELPTSALNALITEAIDLVVHCVRGPEGPRVHEVLALEELVAGTGAVQFTATEVFRRAAHDDRLVWTGQVPVRLTARLAAFGHDVHDLLAPTPGSSWERF